MVRVEPRCNAIVKKASYAESMERESKVQENSRLNEVHTFNMHEYCSSKLWEMVSAEDKRSSPDELRAAIRELAQRRHYLIELEQLGKLTPRN